MSDCPLADDCPKFSERIEGMGCQHYGDRGGAEWCNHYNQPIRDLKSQPVKPGGKVEIAIEDIHESGAGVGRTEDGFIILVDGVLPPSRARVEITKVRSNHARAEELERLPDEGDAGSEADDADADVDADADADADASDEDDGTAEDDEAAEDDEERGPRLGSRDNFWGS